MQSTYLDNFKIDFAKIEAEHYWYRARTKFIKTFLSAAFGNKNKAASNGLEIGPGHGGMIPILRQYVHQMEAVEPSPEGAKALINRYSDLKVYNREAETLLREHKNHYDFIAAFDVLEHIEDDVKALKLCHESMCKDAILLISVPASMLLWSSFDVFDLHYRRYSKAELSSKLVAAGFDPIKISYGFMTLFPAVFLVRKMRDFLKMPPEKQNIDVVKIPNRLVSTILDTLLDIEVKLTKYISLPIGSSLFAIARKRQ